jgi:hypothetical protein
MMTGPSFTPLMIMGLVLFTALVIVLAIAGWRADRRRRERNVAFATSQGWTYSAEDPSLVVLCSTQPFGEGDSQRVREATRGKHRGRDFVVFGYQYDTESTDAQGHTTRTTHFFQVASIEVPGRMPIVRITPESAFSRMAETFGGKDIEVESEEFNRRWRVWSRDARAASAILVPTMIDRLLKSDAQKVPFVFEPGLLMTYEDGKLNLPRFVSRVDLLCSIADLVPKFLAEDYR